MCGACRAPLTFLGKFRPDGTPAKPRTANKMAQFVKEHMAQGGWRAGWRAGGLGQSCAISTWLHAAALPLCPNLGLALLLCRRCLLCCSQG